MCMNIEQEKGFNPNEEGFFDKEEHKDLQAQQEARNKVIMEQAQAEAVGK